MSHLLREAQRVLVVGPCGAGKSTLSRALAAALALPLWHLDKLHWQPGWSPVPERIFEQRLTHLLKQDRWLIDGSFSASLPLRLSRAQLVVHLDYPRRVYMPRLLKRVLSTAPRPDMSNGCEERLDLEFLHFAWRFRREQRPKLLSAIQEAGVRELRLCAPKQADALLLSLGG